MYNDQQQKKRNVIPDKENEIKHLQSPLCFLLFKNNKNRGNIAKQTKKNQVEIVSIWIGTIAVDGWWWWFQTVVVVNWDMVVPGWPECLKCAPLWPEVGWPYLLCHAVLVHTPSTTTAIPGGSINIISKVDAISLAKTTAATTCRQKKSAHFITPQKSTGFHHRQIILKIKWKSTDLHFAVHFQVDQFDVLELLA